MNQKLSRLLLILFFLSGATSLAYETVFVKLLTYIFGGTTYAVSTVLAAFMGGLAIGSFFFGRYVERGRNGLRLYAYLELGVGLYSTIVPLLFLSLEPIYISLFQNFGFSFSALTMVRFFLAGVIVLPPTILMGGTLPALAKYLIRESRQIGPQISLLYAINTYGAAFGVFFVTYFLLGAIGIYGTLAVAILGNIAIFAASLYLNRQFQVTPIASEETPVGELVQGAEELASLSPSLFDRLTHWLGFKRELETTEQPWSDTQLARWIYSFALCSGFLSFAYEVNWTHMLNQTIGTSTYAFGIMLTTMLLGIAAGSHLLGKMNHQGHQTHSRLVMCQFLLGLSTFVLFPFWDDIPQIFKLTGFFRPSFLLTETVRFLGCFSVMFIPALLIGISFPLMIKVRTHQLSRLPGQLGSVYFFNTVGCIIGSTLTGFVLLPRMGSETLLRVTGALSIILAVAMTLVLTPHQKYFRIRILSLALCSCIVGSFVLPHWNLNQMNIGAHLYGVYTENPQQILYYHEDVLGGVTSVVKSGSTLTLLTNAKFMGDDGGEMAAQRNFALVPLVFLHQFQRALVIGLGTGVTADTVAGFPFSEIDVAEIAPGIVEAAQTYFGHVNGNVLKDPRVKVHITDGRNFVMLSPNKYDLITIELSNIWFAGAANLYSKDFYQHCRNHLSPNGILQQWVQLHHIDPLDVLTAINTMHQVFPHTAFFIRGGQGVLIGSPEPLEIDYQLIEKLNQSPSVQRSTQGSKLINGDILTVLEGLYLFEENLTNLLQIKPYAEVSTDWYPVLEYNTPKGNYLPFADFGNVALIEAYRYPQLLPTIKNIPEDKRLYLLGMIAAARNRLLQAEYFLNRSVEQGNSDPRCTQLLKRVQAKMKEIDEHS